MLTVALFKWCNYGWWLFSLYFPMLQKFSAKNMDNFIIRKKCMYICICTKNVKLCIIGRSLHLNHSRHTVFSKTSWGNNFTIFHINSCQGLTSLRMKIYFWLSSACTSKVKWYLWVYCQVVRHVSETWKKESDTSFTLMG